VRRSVRTRIGLAALALSPALARAEGAAVRTTERLVLEYHLDNGNRDEKDDHYGALIERLTITGNADALTTSAEVNGEAFYSPGDERHQNNARLERITAEYALGTLTLTAGDFHKQLGRGIVLSLRKIDEIGLDTTLQGGRVAWAPEGHELEVFAGRTNTSAFDAVDQFFVPEASDVIGGGAYTFRGLEFMTLGTYAYTQRMRIPLVASAGFDHTSASGAFVEVPDLAELVSLYVEADWQGRKSGERRTQGKAFYSTLDFNVGGFNALVEGLLIDDVKVQGSDVPDSPIVFEYAQPPTLERIDQEFEPNTDVRGARLRLAYAFLDGDVTPYLSAMLRQNEPDAENPLNQFHGYGGVETLYDGGSSRLHLSGGYREHRQRGETTKSMKHGEIDWVQRLPGAHALHLTANEEFRTLASRDYVRGSAIVGLERQRLGGLSVEIGNDTQKPHERELYLAGIITWEAADGLLLRATGGSQRGGLKCVGGVCREFPAFTGVKVEATGRHDLL